MEVVTEPLASQHLVNAEAGVAVREGQEEVPAGGGYHENDTTGDPRRDHALACEPFTSRDVSSGSGSLLLSRSDLLVARLLGRGFGVENKLH